MPFDQIDEIPHEARQPGVPLHQLPRGMKDRASHIIDPVALIARVRPAAGFGARRAGLGLLGEDSLDLAVIDHRHGVAALALRGAMTRIGTSAPSAPVR